jgi:hypothetical protein
MFQFHEGATSAATGTLKRISVHKSAPHGKFQDRHRLFPFGCFEKRLKEPVNHAANTMFQVAGAEGFGRNELQCMRLGVPAFSNGRIVHDIRSQQVRNPK